MELIVMLHTVVVIQIENENENESGTQVQSVCTLEVLMMIEVMAADLE